MILTKHFISQTALFPKVVLVENVMNSGISKNNTSGVRGVNYDKDTGQWRVRIQVNNKRISLGSFSDIEKAIRVRQQAEEKYFGEYAYKNIQ